MAAPRLQRPVEPLDLPRPLTWADWRAMPESNRPMELWCGEIEMSPAPTARHQRTVVKLVARLERLAMDVLGAEVYVSPFDVRLADDLVLQPDVLVWTGRAGGRLTPGWIEGPVDLAIEVVSPAGRRRDLVQKASVYAHAGVPEYWVVDPDRAQVIVHLLGENGYERGIAGDSVACAALDGAEIDLTWLRELVEADGSVGGDESAGDGSIADASAEYDASALEDGED